MKKRILVVLMLFSAAALIQGCIVAAVGAGAVGTMAYVKGDLESVEDANIEVVYKATVKAIKDLDLTLTMTEKDALSAQIGARDAQDKKITIKLKAVSGGTTKISVRVGTFGDETKSRLIYEAIQKNISSISESSGN